MGIKRPLDAIEVAKIALYFEPMSNLRLQKVLYFIQGICLARYEIPAFDDKIECWEYGPVVPSVYHKYKFFTSSKINDKIDETDLSIHRKYNPTLVKEIEETVRLLSNIDEWRLVDITHERASPWASGVQTKPIKYQQSPFCTLWVSAYGSESL